MKTVLIPTPLLGESPPIESAPAPPTKRVRPLLAIARWVAVSVWLRLTSKPTPRQKAARLRDLIEQLSGLWVKAGQILSLRRDVFGDEFCVELAKLQDHSRAFEFTTVREIIERDLGQKLEAIFDSFDPIQMAAASIGQTHKARLRMEGKTVAVKVQRPGIDRQFRRDLKIIRLLGMTFYRLSLMEYMRWPDLIAELESTVEEELDYRLEAASIRRMRKTLRRHHVVSPRVYFDYCSARVLVMDFIEGVFMSDYIRMTSEDPACLRLWCEENNVQPRKVARRLFNSLCRQVFEDNLFHGDMHPGNILLLRDSRVGLIDFGSVGSLDVNFMKKYSGFSEAMAGRDFTRAADLLLLLSPSLPPIDLEDVKTKIIRWLKDWFAKADAKNIPFQERSLTAAMGRLSRILTAYGVPTAWELLRIDRTWLAFDSSLMALDANGNFMKMSARYWRAYRGRTLRKVLNTGAVVHQLQQVVPLLAQVPDAMSDLIAHGGEMVRRNLRNFEAQASKLSALFSTLFGGFQFVLVLGNIVVFLLFLHQYVTTRVSDWIGSNFRHFADWFVHLDRMEWVIAQVFLISFFFMSIKLRRRLLQKEVIGRGELI